MSTDYKNPATLRTLYHDEGLTQTEIANRFDVDDSIISRLFSKYDVEVIYNRSRRKIDSADPEELERLYHTERLSQNEIGERYDVSGQTIHRWMEKFNISTQRPRQKDVVQDILAVARHLRRKPKQSDMREHGKYSMNMAQRRFGTWNNALRAAGFEPRGRTGEDNPAWNGGFEKYYGPNWQPQRRKAVIRDQARCQDCGMTESASIDWFGYRLDVHHQKPLKEFKNKGEIDYEQANALTNLVALCRSCHQKRESSC